MHSQNGYLSGYYLSGALCRYVVLYYVPRNQNATLCLIFQLLSYREKNQTQQSGTCSYHTFYGPPPIFLLLLPHQKPKICLNINIYESKICLDGEANRNGDKKNILLVCCTCILCRYSFPNLLYTLLNTLKLWLDDNIFLTIFVHLFLFFGCS